MERSKKEGRERKRKERRRRKKKKEKEQQEKVEWEQCLKRAEEQERKRKEEIKQKKGDRIKQIQKRYIQRKRLEHASDTDEDGFRVVTNKKKAHTKVRRIEQEQESQEEEIETEQESSGSDQSTIKGDTTEDDDLSQVENTNYYQKTITPSYPLCDQKEPSQEMLEDEGVEAMTQTYLRQKKWRTCLT